MIRILRLAAVAIVLGAWPALAGPVEGGANASGQAQSEAQAAPSGIVFRSASDASAKATVSGPEFEQLKQNVKSKGAKVSTEARQRTDTKLAASAKLVDQQAAKAPKGITERLAAEFSLSPADLVAEQQSLGASWGQLMIAHTVAANTNVGVTVAQLFAMRQDGMGWGQIAAGLDLTLGEVVSAVNAESGVALGRSNADGKVAIIHGPGSRAGVSAGASAGAGLGAAGKSASAGVGLDAGAGVKIKP